MSHSSYANVAELYEAFVQTQFDIDFWIREAQQTDGEILELMAGTGRVTLPLVQAGARVAAVDNSPEMLAILRAKLAHNNLTADVVQMDVRDLDFDKQFDLIILPFHALGELTDLSDQQHTLNSVYRCLADGERFICTLHNPPARLQSVNGQLKLWGKRSLDDGGALFLWALETYDAQTRIVAASEFYEVYDATGVMLSRQLFEIRFRLTDQREFQAMAEAAGFKIAALYGDYAGADFDETDSPVMIWVLQR
jgi:SAM-dependent methyltransferase